MNPHPSSPSSNSFGTSDGRLFRWYRSNKAAPAIVLISGLGFLAMAVSVVIAGFNPTLVMVPLLTLVLVGVAVAIALSIGDIPEGGHSRGNDGGGRRDGAPPLLPKEPDSDQGLPAWLGSFEGELADEPSPDLATRV